MIPRILLSVAFGLASASAWAQDRVEESAVVQEWYGAMLPEEGGTAAAAPSPQSLGRAEAFLPGVNVRELAPVTTDEVAEADRRAAEDDAGFNPGPARVGFVRPFGPVIAAIEAANAVVTVLEDGRRMWTAVVRSPGALAMRIHLSGFDVGYGEATVYSNTPEGLVVRGPYTGRGPNGDGEFWTASVQGDTAYLEVVSHGDVRFVVGEVLHFDRGFGDVGAVADAQGGPLACHEDVMCHSPSTFARQATGRMNYLVNGVGKVCTGTLLNDQDSETVVPYFLTAYHCISTQSVTNTLEVTWFWQKSVCDGSLPSFASLPSNVGGTLWKTNPTDGGNDMAFIQLNGGLPGGIGLVGWSTGHPDPAYGIHHPAGDWKRWTFLADTGICPGCEFCGDGTDYDYYDILDGAIEPGSSGSGIFDSSGRLTGQLFGHCCVNASCAGETIACGNLDEFTIQYGEFETTHPIISRHLQIGGTMHVNWAAILGGNGTPALPYRTVGQAHANAWNGLRLKILAGHYAEAVTLSKAVSLVANGGTVVIGQ